MRLAAASANELLDHMFGSLARGQGGWIVTANLDFLRRHAHDPAARELYSEADVCVADGMPLVWAMRLQGDHLPERIAGSSLMLPVAERAALEGRSLYLLGGEPAANEKAAAVLRARSPWRAATALPPARPISARVAAGVACASLMAATSGSTAPAGTSHPLTRSLTSSGMPAT